MLYSNSHRICNCFIFSKVAALAKKNGLFWPFLFNALAALGHCAPRGHFAAIRFAGA
jgi:hypothetical protein